MNNNPTITRTPKSAKVAWLLEHPGVWAGYPVPGIKHALRIFTAMQADGLFSPRSQCNKLTISRLVEDAGLAQALHSDAKALQESIRNMEAIKS